MKSKIKNWTLVFGVIVALIALSNSNTYAEKLEQNSIEEITAIEADMLQEVEQLLTIEQPEEPCIERIKVFNSENQLIYECRGADDQRLNVLLRRSDLIFQTDSSSYYLLGD